MKSTRSFHRQKLLSHELRSEWVSEQANEWAQYSTRRFHRLSTQCAVVRHRWRIFVVNLVMKSDQPPGFAAEQTIPSLPNWKQFHRHGNEAHVAKDADITTTKCRSLKQGCDDNNNWKAVLVKQLAWWVDNSEPSLGMAVVVATLQWMHRNLHKNAASTTTNKWLFWHGD